MEDLSGLTEVDCENGAAVVPWLISLCLALVVLGCEEELSKRRELEEAIKDQ